MTTRTLSMFKRLLLALSVCAAGGVAQAGTPAEAVDAFHKALRDGKRDAAIEMLTKDASVFETGYVEPMRDQYAGEHLKQDMEFAAKTKRNVLRRETQIDGNSAWVLSLTETIGDFGERHVELEGTETVILRLVGEDWKIAHIHWSAHPRGE